MPDSVTSWAARYRELDLAGERSEEVTARVMLHLGRFAEYLTATYGHDRLSSLVRRDVVGWRDQLAKTLAASTVNHHLASASGFLAWVAAQAPDTLPAGNPGTGVGTLALPPLEPQALTPAQVRSLKSVVDRLERFHLLKGRQAGDHEAGHAHGRPLRDGAIVYLLLSTGLRREELVNLDLAQLAPATPAGLRAAKRARLTGVRGKGNTTRTVFISADARAALADYLEAERPDDAGKTTTALFASAVSIASRRPDGRMSTRAVNLILERIGAWHDAEQTDPNRRLGQLRPHALRHTFAFALSEQTGHDAYELERRLGHHSQRYIARYTNPPEDVAASYVEGL